MPMKHSLAAVALAGIMVACVGTEAPPVAGKRVETVENGRTRVVVYDAAGAVLQIEEPVDEQELPTPVADAMHSHRRAIFVSATKITRQGQVEYHLTVRGSRKTAMVTKADGTVVSFQ